MGLGCARAPQRRRRLAVLDIRTVAFGSFFPEDRNCVDLTSWRLESRSLSDFRHLPKN